MFLLSLTFRKRKYCFRMDWLDCLFWVLKLIFVLRSSEFKKVIFTYYFLIFLYISRDNFRAIICRILFPCTFGLQTVLTHCGNYSRIRYLRVRTQCTNHSALCVRECACEVWRSVLFKSKYSQKISNLILVWVISLFSPTSENFFFKSTIRKCFFTESIFQFSLQYL